MSLLMINTEIAPPAARRTEFAKLLAYGMGVVVCLHAVALLVMRSHTVAVSRYLTAAIPILATMACLWRARRLPSRERPVWLWSSAGLLLWAVAHLVETMFGHSTAASS